MRTHSTPLRWAPALCGLVLVLAGCGEKKGTPAADKPKPRPPTARPAGNPFPAGLAEKHVLVGHELGIEALTFSPDGKLLVSGSNDKTVKVWDVATGKLKRTFEGHTGWVPAVAYHPTDALVLSGSGDKTWRINRVNRKTKPIVVKDHNGLLAVAFGPQGKLVVTGGFGGGLRLWHATSGDWRRTYKGHTLDVYAVAFDADGSRLISGSVDKTVRLWDTASGKTLQTLKGAGDWVRAVAFAADGKQVIGASKDRKILFWDAASGKLLRTLDVPGSEPLRGAAFSPNRAHIACAVGRRVVLIESSSGKVVRQLGPEPKPVFVVAFSPDGKTLAYAGADAKVRVYSTEQSPSR